MVSPENSCWDGKSPRTPLVKEKVYTEGPQGEGGLFTLIGSHCSLSKYQEKEGSASLSLGAEAENQAPSNDPACTRPRGLGLPCPEGGRCGCSPQSAPAAPTGRPGSAHGDQTPFPRLSHQGFPVANAIGSHRHSPRRADTYTELHGNKHVVYSPS